MVGKRYTSIVLLVLSGLGELAHSQSTSTHSQGPMRPGLIRQTSVASEVVDNLVAGPEDADTEVRWSGFLETPYAGTYRFAVRVTGEVTITLGDVVILSGRAETPTWIASDPLELSFDSHRLLVVLRPTDNGQETSLAAFWSGPAFQFEPLPSSRLSHLAGTQIVEEPLLGQDLIRGLRCQACHVISGLPESILRAPNLTHAFHHLQTNWLKSYLTLPGRDTGQGHWADFHGQFDASSAEDVVAFLARIAGNARPTGPLQHPREGGRHVFLHRGCIACHSHEGQGASGMFDGGDLTQLEVKRPAGFLETWLSDPDRINPDHRMPRFELSATEIGALSTWLQPTRRAAERKNEVVPSGSASRGRQLVAERQCAACHTMTGVDEKSTRLPLGDATRWELSCLTRLPSSSRQPGYRITSTESVRAVKHHVAAHVPLTRQREGALLLRENNCLSCHPRDERLGLQPIAEAFVSKHAELQTELPRVRAPSLNSVGDKFHEAVLVKIIAGEAPVRRPWLHLRMPQFPLDRAQVATLVDYFVLADRIPDEAVRRDPVPEEAPEGSDRLVTADGFGCISCHQLGKVRPPETTPINQLGPALDMVGATIRKAWFDRWVRNPARIVPNMEMPSVQVAIPNFLAGNLDHQLHEVWRLLNRRRFDPPDPAPTRIASHSGLADAPSLVLTDVLRVGGKTLVKPFLIGLPNRHNVLLDLEQGSLAAWWTGDTAVQRTQGKSWYWQAPFFGVRSVVDAEEFVLVHRGRFFAPQRLGQFVTEPDAWQTTNKGVTLQHRLHFATTDSPTSLTLRVTQSFTTRDNGWTRTIQFLDVPSGDAIALRATGTPPAGVVDERGYYTLQAKGSEHHLELHYAHNEKPAPATPAPHDAPPETTRTLPVVPGFRAVVLPLNSEVMPTAIAWTPGGDLLLASLKGRVWRARDTNGDQLEDSMQAISDDLAAPYGLHAEDQFVDVVTKFGVVRLWDEDQDGQTDRHQLVASGWGHTADYHDWAVGLPQDESGNYVVAIPCQQDDRTAAAAHLRGTVVRLSPRAPTPNAPQLFTLEALSHGHRFPMGIARSRHGEIFVTDNQGNFNPFNELNHVVKGAHYGFINRLDEKPGYAPALTPPAIEIPHPWTRSVNGICFLETPQNLPTPRFGPFEGHLIGCEYDTRRLIRMSVEVVEGWWQGAAYPFAIAPDDLRDALQGPINCGVAPDGAIYVANMRDSGWGGANNSGSVVRIVPAFENLPCGIAEVNARPFGFQIRFTRPVDTERASHVDHYVVSSYRRISTPAYGGDDVDRRAERVSQVVVAHDGASVELHVKELRPGFVYEIRVRDLVVNAKDFFPDEAYYTLRRVPK